MADTISHALPHVLRSSAEWFDDVERLVYDRQKERWLFGWAANARLPHRVNTRLSDVLVAADMPRLAFSPHCLRHTAATNLSRAGVPLDVLADLLGHTSIETTRRYIATSGQLSRWLADRKVKDGYTRAGGGGGGGIQRR
jgi:site-specific recombinase XerD